MSAPTHPPPTTRVFAALLAACALAVLITAACIQASPTGEGTHRQLGLPPCGWLAMTGYPCPTCGMTTAFSLAAHSRPLDSIKTQFFGAGFAIATTVFFWAALHVAIFGSMLGRLFERLLAPRLLVPVAVLFLAAWAVKSYTMHH
jgi:hypothetical protein